MLERPWVPHKIHNFAANAIRAKPIIIKFNMETPSAVYFRPAPDPLRLRLTRALLCVYYSSRMGVENKLGV